MMNTCHMQRTWISLTAAERCALDEEAARTGRSISALVRDAVNVVYGVKRAAEDDLAITRKAFGAWKDRESDGESWVEGLRSGSRSAQ